jgi:gamma-butyrobetaine dioxygenase
MRIHDLTVCADTLVVTWADTTTTGFPTIWLRDNCPSGLHPQTHERLLDLLTLVDTPVLSSAQLDSNYAQLSYADGHISQLPLSLLTQHRPGQRAADPAAIEKRLWRSEHRVARYAAPPIVNEDTALTKWMQVTAADGITIVENLEDRISAGVDLAERIGFLRKTNFGTTFEVINKPDPNNLAYTSVALPLYQPAVIRTLEPIGGVRWT